MVCAYLVCVTNVHLEHELSDSFHSLSRREKLRVLFQDYWYPHMARGIPTALHTWPENRLQIGRLLQGGKGAQFYSVQLICSTDALPLLGSNKRKQPSSQPAPSDEQPSASSKSINC